MPRVTGAWTLFTWTLLEATLSQPITGASQINIRSQTPLGAFPVTVEGLRLNPVGAIRHSGYLRLTNLGSVRLQPTALSGLTQLAPDQFSGDAIEARQTFVYRFPAADHIFTVVADSIEPDVSVSELVVYQLAETDRIINADIEIDVRAKRQFVSGILACPQTIPSPQSRGRVWRTTSPHDKQATPR